MAVRSYSSNVTENIEGVAATATAAGTASSSANLERYRTMRLDQLKSLNIPLYPRIRPEAGTTAVTTTTSDGSGSVGQIGEFIHDFEPLLKQPGTKLTQEEFESLKRPIPTVAGRVVARREASNSLIFFDIVQNGHRLQVVSSKRNHASADSSESMTFDAIRKGVHLGDTIQVAGLPGLTKTSELSLYSSSMRLLTPCIRPIPFDSGLRDPNKRFRQRHLDLIVNSSSALHILRTRSHVIRLVRQFLDSRNFLEVETPILWPQCGGAAARPFITKANALDDLELNLRIAPELFLKQLVIGGMERVYEIGKQFRNEGIDADHNPEFTTCEFYMAYADIDALMYMTEQLLREIVAKTSTDGKRSSVKLPVENGVDGDNGAHQSVEIDFAKSFARIDVTDELERCIGCKLPDFSPQNQNAATEALMNHCRTLKIAIPSAPTIPRLLDAMIGALIEPQCEQPTFLFGHPAILSPLAKSFTSTDASSSASSSTTTTAEASTMMNRKAARFELFVAGKELVNAYEELNDPAEQRERFMEQQRDRQRGDDEAPIPDEGFCEALEVGLPPTGGWGMGIDRVVSLVCGGCHMRETLTFPVMKPE
ncbi:lysyl-tRNA synthetase [Ramicandelaber brevisporus]|nr:lysyl-tRNA synthetase [Ramicandelaber brevisporus]